MGVSEKAELKLTIEAARSGDDKAFESLIKAYSPLISSLVSKFSQSELTDADDLRQEALIIFCNAVMKFDLTQDKVDFGLYAKVCIERGLISQLRAINKRIRPEQIDDESEFTPSEDPSLHIIENESVREMWELFDRMLSDYENKVWTLHLSGASTTEIAGRLGKDEKSISNALCRIRAKLRRALAERYRT